MHISQRYSLQQDFGRSIPFRLRPKKKAYRNIRFAHEAWKIPVGAAALLTACQAAASGAQLMGGSDDHDSGTDGAGPGIVPDVGNQECSWLLEFVFGRNSSLSPPALTLECIGNSDALYHNIEHSLLVTLVGHDILAGRELQRATTAWIMRTSFWPASPTTSGTFGEYCRETKTTPILQTLAGGGRCRLGHQMPRSAPIMSTAQNCSSFERFDGAEEVDAAELPEPSNIRAFPTSSPGTTT